MRHKTYSVLDLHVESEPVWFETGSGEVRGFLKLIGKNKDRSYRAYVDRTKTVDLPYHFVLSWRPVSFETWPEPLPSPSLPMKDPKRQPERPRAPVEPREKLLWWESPDLRLGSPGEPPVCLRECEARILRAWRTSEFLGSTDEDRKRLKAERVAWPQDLRVASNVMEAILKRDRRNARLREEDYSDFNLKVDKSDSRERPVRWTPTRRDVGDIDPPGVLEWLRDLSYRDKGMLNLRTAQPPFSWEEISTVPMMDGRARQVLQRRYKRIIEQAFKRAIA